MPRIGRLFFRIRNIIRIDRWAAILKIYAHGYQGENVELFVDGKRYRPLLRNYTKWECAAMCLCGAIYVLLRVWNLPGTLVSNKFDEGVYLSLMLGVASGRGHLYQDYMLCHPPGVLWAGIVLWPLLRGSLTCLRIVYIGFCALALPPVYAVVRRHYGVNLALLSLLLLAASPGTANWLGREIYLDPPLNVPICWAIWLLVNGTGRARRDALAAGLLLGFSYLIKETAVPAAFAMGAALWWSGHQSNDTPVTEGSSNGGRVETQRLIAFGGGFAFAFVLTLATLARTPNYVYYTFTLNAHDTFRWDLRLNEMITGFYALPFQFTVGVIGVWHLATRGQTRSDKLLGAYAIGNAALMIVVPRAFYWRYLMASVPILCIGASLWFQKLLVEPRTKLRRRVEWIFASAFGIVHLLSLVLYHVYEAINPPEIARGIRMLHHLPGPLFTLNPIWSAASGQPLTPNTQRLIRVTINLPLRLNEVDRALDECPTVALDRTTMRWLPAPVLASMRSRYHTVFCYDKIGAPHYFEILCRPNQPGQAVVPEKEGRSD